MAMGGSLAGGVPSFCLRKCGRGEAGIQADVARRPSHDSGSRRPSSEVRTRSLPQGQLGKTNTGTSSLLQVIHQGRLVWQNHQGQGVELVNLWKCLVNSNDGSRNGQDGEVFWFVVEWLSLPFFVERQVLLATAFKTLVKVGPESLHAGNVH